MRAHLTVVGGGLGGLVAAISSREAGFEVTLHEARKELGGRARTTPGPRRANWGPHVIYSDGPLWAWLDQRGLARPAGSVPNIPRLAFRVDGCARTLPPRRVLAALLRLRGSEAPVDRAFRDWTTERLGDPEVAGRISNLMGVATFDHDPGRLSAAFVNERLRRGTRLPSPVRYVPGGWATLVDRLAGHARRIGVRIETDSPVDRLPPAPVVLAVALARAAELLDDRSLTWTGTRTALLDVGLARRRRDPFIVSDLDAPGWVETYSIADASLAPPGEHLVQSQTGLRPGETLDQGVARLEQLLDTAFVGWRDRETWRRRLAVTDESGALDLPGTTWRDRPGGDRGDGVFVVGDMVAAPGLLSEVTHQSAVDAVSRLTGERRLTRVA
ncbi:MAG TPA: NAD(P)-binding protein [Acidimicrobiales bacterium]|nr:NAD(P)-binding protein [Acidimicrobiales bacterium]